MGRAIGGTGFKVLSKEREMCSPYSLIKRRRKLSSFLL